MLFNFIYTLAYMTEMQVVASQDWPEITKYAGLVCAQAHRQELIQDLYKEWQDPNRGKVSGGMVKYALSTLSVRHIYLSLELENGLHVFRRPIFLSDSFLLPFLHEKS